MGLFSKKNKSRQDGLVVWLEHDGRIIFQLEEKNFDGNEITIGRSSQCTWSLKNIDESVSVQHAIISMRRGMLYITDMGSKNGLLYNDKKITEKQLEAGDEIVMGESLLIVQKKKPGEQKEIMPHQIEYVNEKGKKIRVELKKEDTIVGSGKDCDIVIKDKMISSQHLRLSLKSDGSCWVQDLGSRNGTKVNDEELGFEEYPLKNKDVITMAFLDITFLDGALIDEEPMPVIWKALTICATTAIVAIACVLIYKYVFEAPWKEHMADAREYITIGEFDNARNSLREALNVSRSEVQKRETHALLNEIKEIEDTRDRWEAAKQNLQKNKFEDVSRELSDLNKKLHWTWPGAGLEKTKAIMAKNLLDKRSEAINTFKQNTTDKKEIDDQLKVLNSLLGEGGRYKDETYVQTIIGEIKPMTEKLKQTLQESESLEDTIKLLANEKPDYQTIIDGLEPLASKSLGAIKTKANKMLPLVKLLKTETERVSKLKDMAWNLQFQDVANFRLAFNTNTDWTVNSHIKELKDKLEKYVTDLQNNVRAYAGMYMTLNQNGIVQGTPNPDLEAFLDDAKMQTVYSYDCFNLPLPKNFRQEPSGVYDEMLGIEYFYNYIKMLEDNSVIPAPDPDIFTCRLYNCRLIIKNAESGIEFIKRPEYQWLNKGKVSEYIAYCQSLVDKREKIIQEQLGHKAEVGSRDFLVSRGIALYLSSDLKDTSSLQADLIQGFQDYKKKMNNLRKRFDRGKAVEKIATRTQMFEIGLPGDAELQSRWKQHLRQRGLE
jgi:pSer/pThr/pTyr-binding forkhead associated (FHA) protein